MGPLYPQEICCKKIPEDFHILIAVMDHGQVPGSEKKDIGGIFIEKRVELVIKPGPFLSVKGKPDLFYKLVGFFAHIGTVIAGGGDGCLGRVPQLEGIGLQCSGPA